MSKTGGKIIGGIAMAAGVVGVGFALWLWFKKTDEDKPEVFVVGDANGAGTFHRSEIDKVIQLYGSIATFTQMKEAQENGASWCASCWTLGDDNKMHVTIPLDATMAITCPGGHAGLNDVTLVPEQMDTYTEYVAVYGIKPKVPKDANHKLIPWNATKYSRWEDNK